MNMKTHHRVKVLISTIKITTIVTNSKWKATKTTTITKIRALKSTKEIMTMMTMNRPSLITSTRMSTLWNKISKRRGLRRELLSMGQLWEDLAVITSRIWIGLGNCFMRLRILAGSWYVALLNLMLMSSKKKLKTLKMLEKV